MLLGALLVGSGEAVNLSELKAEDICIRDYFVFRYTEGSSYNATKLATIPLVSFAELKRLGFMVYDNLAKSPQKCGYALFQEVEASFNSSGTYTDMQVVLVNLSVRGKNTWGMSFDYKTSDDPVRHISPISKDMDKTVEFFIRDWKSSRK